MSHTRDNNRRVGSEEEYADISSDEGSDHKIEQHNNIQPNTHQWVQATLEQAYRKAGLDDTKLALVDIATELKPTGPDKLGLAVESLESVAGTMSATGSTAGVAAEKLGPAVTRIKSAVEPIAPAFVEDTSYSVRMTDMNKFEMGILMRPKADEERLEGEVAEKNMRELFISNQFKPTLDNVREDKRKPTSEQQEAMEEQVSLEEQPEPIEERILPRRGRRSSTVDTFK